MLYDPKWQKPEVKADPSLTGFIAWLETQPPKAKYQFYECDGRCLLGQYMAAIGIPWTGAPDKASGDWGKSSYLRVARVVFGGQPGDTANLEVLSKPPYTFGAALSRARKALAVTSCSGNGG